MITTKDLGKMPCLQCKEYFWPTTSFLSKQAANSFYYCKKCIQTPLSIENSCNELVEFRSAINEKAKNNEGILDFLKHYNAEGLTKNSIIEHGEKLISLWMSLDDIDQLFIHALFCKNYPAQIETIKGLICDSWNIQCVNKLKKLMKE